ncbi:hypothetical protein M011DRAFT_506608 [Sporormia fimetaria CBS 119925]|uniref:Uncharacterized protein n=1 Tax=Sporormia fimetaria CBS 119925 TaxID=1340428 RepID=A0A6A6V1L9_9PLEO|nr:hypothetical protein M011DRAFT_506608 [Sporormia fimetaria CBS 119925]
MHLVTLITLTTSLFTSLSYAAPTDASIVEARADKVPPICLEACFLRKPNCPVPQFPRKFGDCWQCCFAGPQIPPPPKARALEDDSHEWGKRKEEDSHEWGKREEDDGIDWGKNDENDSTEWGKRDVEDGSEWNKRGHHQTHRAGEDSHEWN